MSTDETICCEGKLLCLHFWHKIWLSAPILAVTMFFVRLAGNSIPLQCIVTIVMLVMLILFHLLLDRMKWLQYEIPYTLTETTLTLHRKGQPVQIPLADLSECMLWRYNFYGASRGWILLLRAGKQKVKLYSAPMPKDAATSPLYVLTAAITTRISHLDVVEALTEADGCWLKRK